MPFCACVVEWRSGEEGQSYDLGQKGNVELAYIKPADGGSVYVDHLPAPCEYIIYCLMQ